MSVETEQTRALSKLIGYLRRQGNQCNAQQPVVPVAGSELLKAADLLEASGIAELTEALELALDCLAVGDPEREHPRVREALVKGKVALANAKWGDKAYDKLTEGDNHFARIGGNHHG
jgi:hypothetical protein